MAYLALHGNSKILILTHTDFHFDVIDMLFLNDLYDKLCTEDIESTPVESITSHLIMNYWRKVT